MTMGMNPQKWLQPGDKVSIEVTAIGELADAVAAAWYQQRPGPRGLRG